jgi:hypothetical protein
VRGWIEWFARGLWKRRKPILTTVAVVTVLVAFGLARNLDFSRRPPRTIHDPSFERAAVAICTKEVRPLAERQRSSKEQGKYNDTPKANAVRVDRAADDLASAVDHLRALPSRPESKARVDEWLHQYDRFIAAGHRYADALRTGNEEIYTKADDESVEPHKRISDFARANHLDACNP